MATLTISVPDTLKKRLDAHPEINWSAYLRERFSCRVKEFEKFEELKKQGAL